MSKGYSGLSGSSGISAGGTVSAERKKQLSNGIATHTKAENDRAERGIEQSLQKEKNIVSNADSYIRAGHIKSRNDPWFQGHVESYNSLKAQLSYFRKERKRQGR